MVDGTSGQELTRGRDAAASFLIEFVRSPFAEVCAWVGTALGGILVSGSAGNPSQFWFGVALIVVLLAPLTIQSGLNWADRRRDLGFDTKERFAIDFANDFIMQVAEFESLPMAVRRPRAENAIDDAMERIRRQVFDANPRIRIVEYELSDDGRALSVVKQIGRADPAGDFDADVDAVGASVVARLQDVEDSFYWRRGGPIEALGTDGRPYAAFISLPLRSFSDGFGMLTVDSTRADDLAPRDAELLETYAAAISFYRATTIRGSRPRRQEDRP